MRTVTLLLVVLTSPLLAQPIKVMTYNIRYDNPGDGVNQWDNRKHKVIDLIIQYDPDIIGVQEALLHQLQDIASGLKGYEFFGAGRDDGKQKGEYSAVFVRKKRLKVQHHETFWLSKTPGVPGSKDWDAAITRVATWARLRDQKTRRDFLIINTHFDHVGKESRKNSAALLKQKAAELSEGLPVIITGDFNFTRDRAPYAIMMEPEPITLYDAAPADTPGTACGFVVDARPCVAIDYIFHTPEWSSQNYQVIADHDGKHFPSDHLPVITSLKLKK